jgi:hypothetical protein
MLKQITVYWCNFCGSEFATFSMFPDDILPYCVNCSNDEDITCVGKGRVSYE